MNTPKEAFEKVLTQYLAPELASRAATQLVAELGPILATALNGVLAVTSDTAQAASIAAPGPAVPVTSRGGKRDLKPDSKAKMSAKKALYWAQKRKEEGKEPKPGDEKILARHEAQKAKEAALAAKRGAAQKAKEAKLAEKAAAKAQVQEQKAAATEAKRAAKETKAGTNGTHVSTAAPL